MYATADQGQQQAQQGAQNYGGYQANQYGQQPAAYGGVTSQNWNQGGYTQGQGYGQQNYGAATQGYYGQQWQQQGQGGQGVMNSMGYGPVRGGGNNRNETRTNPYSRPGQRFSNPPAQLNSAGYPIRPLVKNCSFYEKTGKCRYGSECRWNHPEGITPTNAAQNATPDCKMNSRGFPLRPDQMNCKYYMEMGTCKFGQTCKWNHPEGVESKLEMNAQGYPKRPECEVCQYYAKTGSCSFGSTCKYHHPELEELEALKKEGKEEEAKDEQYNPADPAEMNSKGFPLRPDQPTCTYYLKFQTCKYGATCRFNHPEDVEAEGAALMAQQATSTPPDGVNSKGYPIRYNAPACTFYIKTGNCKFGNTCKYNHPEQNGSDAGVQYNSKGLPVRPGAMLCKFYAQNGTCSFGSTCKYDHPEMGNGGTGGGMAKMGMGGQAQMGMGGIDYGAVFQ